MNRRPPPRPQSRPGHWHHNYYWRDYPYRWYWDNDYDHYDWYDDGMDLYDYYYHFDRYDTSKEVFDRGFRAGLKQARIEHESKTADSTPTAGYCGSMGG